ncbi:AtpZ/AtpI family protein [Cupriavidus sp. BIS7]|uniref:AtpZ/AtpI family protein n=1 Tax=Cupriavidus sp. BIS7 TaxID=1217718 RepID=UPI0002DBB2D0|nr:AtpZ/AtpI family protein [Cupriavidus sp. BIS7]
MSQEDDNLRRTLARQVKQLRDARPAGLVGLLVIGGTVGLLLVVPVIVGAYLGRWLDEQLSGYSVRWTVNLILLGLLVGVVNVILFFRSHDR